MWSPIQAWTIFFWLQYFLYCDFYIKPSNKTQCGHQSSYTEKHEEKMQSRGQSCFSSFVSPKTAFGFIYPCLAKLTLQGTQYPQWLFRMFICTSCRQMEIKTALWILWILSSSQLVNSVATQSTHKLDLPLKGFFVNGLWSFQPSIQTSQVGGSFPVKISCIEFVQND